MQNPGDAEPSVPHNLPMQECAPKATRDKARFLRTNVHAT